MNAMSSFRVCAGTNASLPSLTSLPNSMCWSPSVMGSGYGTTIIWINSRMLATASSITSTSPLVVIAATAPESFSRYATSLARNCVVDGTNTPPNLATANAAT